MSNLTRNNFYIKEIIYLELIIILKEIKIDLKKIDTILN